ncbi:unnamed protein product [Gordionus sp. m RMFG-2023]|uniref:puromycin-sensitive aminopeptidase-like n=1 Tax=Gordionus sp. m RMFG-2023 TaxID=3053472 RepID=UPI0030E192CB
MAIGSNTQNANEKKTFQRLPKTVIPRHYDIEIKPNLKNLNFTGKELIDIEIKEATNKIVLNSLELVIKDAQLINDKKETTKANISYDIENEQAIFNFTNQLNPGKAHLQLTFDGKLSDKMRGFYITKYMYNKEEKIAATTHFESTDARRAFPCWDEPAIKAKFSITLVAPKDFVALSNMPVEKEVQDKDAHEKTVKFQCTPIMSTYIVAFVVGEFDYVEDKTKDGKPCRVYTPVGKKEQGRFALEVTVKSLEFYEEYFGIKYELPKCDLISIPDFAFGAMENWGLITFREVCILLDEKTSSTNTKNYIAIVVAHELGHQWFGNLATMEWWTYLWLNEGFATWVSFHCISQIYPHYDIWTQFVSSSFHEGITLDSLATSHPIEVTVHHPHEIDEIFDAISYEKGASFLRMMNEYCGPEAFRKALNIYLNEFKYSNASITDFMRALETASGKDLKAMETWYKKIGFPLINVEEVREGTNRKLKISQQKFLLKGPVSDGTVWDIPMTFCDKSNPQKHIHSMLINKPTMEVELKNVPVNDWIKLNCGTVSFCRVNYTPDMLAAIMPGVEDNSLAPLDRYGIESDAFALVQAGMLPLQSFLKLLKAFRNETNYAVWCDLSSSLGVLGILSQYIQQDNVAGGGEDKKETKANAGKVESVTQRKFKQFAAQLMTPIYQKLGWEPKKGESHVDAMLRVIILSRLARCDYAPVKDEACKRFDALCKGGTCTEMSGDLRAAIYTSMLSNADEKMYDQFLEMARNSNQQEEKVRIYARLGLKEDAKLIQKTLDLADSDEIRLQDKVGVFSSLCGHRLGRKMTWEFLKKNWSRVLGWYGGLSLMSRLVKNVTSNFATEEEAMDVEKFFKTHEAPAAEMAIQQSLENIRINASMLKRDGESFKEYLHNN